MEVVAQFSDTKFADHALKFYFKTNKIRKKRKMNKIMAVGQNSTIFFECMFPNGNLNLPRFCSRQKNQILNGVRL